MIAWTSTSGGFSGCGVAQRARACLRMRGQVLAIVRCEPPPWRFDASVCAAAVADLQQLRNADHVAQRHELRCVELACAPMAAAGWTDCVKGLVLEEGCNTDICVYTTDCCA